MSIVVRFYVFSLACCFDSQCGVAESHVVEKDHLNTPDWPSALGPCRDEMQLPQEMRLAFVEQLDRSFKKLSESEKSRLTERLSLLGPAFCDFKRGLMTGALTISNLTSDHLHFWVYAILRYGALSFDLSHESGSVDSAEELCKLVYPSAFQRLLDSMPETQRKRWRPQIDEISGTLTKSTIDYIRACQEVTLFPGFRKSISREALSRAASNLLEQSTPPIYGAKSAIMKSDDEAFLDALKQFVVSLGVALRGELLMLSLYPECLQQSWLSVKGMGYLISEGDGLPLVTLKLNVEKDHEQ